MPRSDGAAVFCPTCGAEFGGMVECPFDQADLKPLPDADPIAVAFYAAINAPHEPDDEFCPHGHYRARFCALCDEEAES